jgi:hypothetical protein
MSGFALFIRLFKDIGLAGLCSALLSITVLMTVASPANADWRGLRFSAAYEAGEMRFSQLLDFTDFAFAPGEGSLDLPREYRYEYRDGDATGFRLGVEFNDEFEVIWSRVELESSYRILVDDVELVDDTVTRVSIPDIDFRFDMISLGYQPAALRRWGVGPRLRAGYGWVLHSESGPLQPLAIRGANHSDSDKGFEFSGGLEGRWRWLRAGAEIRTFHWRWSPNDPPNEGEDRVPSTTAHSMQFGFWAGASF